MKAVNSIPGKAIVLLFLICVCLSGCREKSGSEFIFQEFPFPGYTVYSILDHGRLEKELVIPTEYKGYPVTYICGSAFEFSKIRSLHMESVEYIEDFAFYFCHHLEKLELGCAKNIGKSAFMSCHELASVTIPASVACIQENAFADCENLRSVYFEGDPADIHPNAFDKGVILYGRSGTSLEKFAHDNGFRFIIWEGEATQPAA